MRNRILVIGAALVAVAAIGSAQSQRGAATLDDVVSELRALRADLRQTTRATTEVQMLTVRLQLQEQRLAVLSNQHAEVSSKLAIESRERTEKEAEAQTFEESFNRNELIGIPRAELTAILAERKRAAETHREAERQLRAHESRLATEIANEQNRWQDFNNRLDELERSLK